MFGGAGNAAMNNNPNRLLRRRGGEGQVLENDMQGRTNEKIRDLERSAASIKEGAQAIKKHMINEEGLLVDVEKGFEKN